MVLLFGIFRVNNRNFKAGPVLSNKEQAAWGKQPVPLNFTLNLNCLKM